MGPRLSLKENLESFFRQDYPSYEILIAAGRRGRFPALGRGQEEVSAALSGHPLPHPGYGARLLGPTLRRIVSIE